MKRIIGVIAVLMLLSLTGCRKYDEALQNINNRLDNLEGSRISTIEQQVDAIKKSLPLLESTNKELGKYIESLQASYKSLLASVEEIDSKIKTLSQECADENKQLLNNLEQLRYDLQQHIDAMAETITALQTKDKDIEERLTALQQHVESLSGKYSSPEWVEATFATLEMHNALVSDLAVLQGKIDGMTQSIADLETRMEKKITQDIASALTGLNEDIKVKIEQVTSACTASVKTAKEEITAAYTDAISKAIAGLESSLKQWVNEQLKGYYTIAQIEEKLASVRSLVSSANAIIEDEIDKVYAAIDAAKSEITAAYRAAIEEAITVEEGKINSMIAAEIATATADIDKSIKDLYDRFTYLLEKISTAEGQISTLEEQVNYILSTLSSLDELNRSVQDAIASLEESDKARVQDIEDLKTRAANLESLIAGLKQYVESEIEGTESWVAGTFATLAQYYGLVDEITAIKAILDANSETMDSQMEEKLNAHTGTVMGLMQSWVTDELEEYCTISEMQGRLSYLQSQYEAGDDAVREEIDALAEKIEAMKSEYVGICYNIVEQSIEDNNGVIDDKIAARCAQLSAEIDSRINEINIQLTDIEARLSKVETSIATIENQIIYILSSLPELKDADTELKEYIDKLQYFVDELRLSMDEVNAEIEEVISTISEEDQKIVDELRARYDALNSLIESEILQLESAVAQLEASDSQLQKNIEELQIYVDEELASQKEWTEATFATLDHFSYLSSELSSIKTMIESINAGMEQLEVRISAKIEKDIADAISALDADLQDDINAAMQQCYGEIEYVKNQITDAYTTEIQSAMVSVEYSIKSWVNSELDGYYTIAKVDELLEAMKSDFESELASQRSYLVDLINSLSDELKSSIERNTYYVNELQSKMSTLEPTVAEHAEAIAANSTKVAENADAILQHSAQISYCMDEIGLIKTNISSLEDQLNAKIDQLENSFNNQGGSAESEIETLRTEISSLQTQLEAKISQVEGLAYSNESLINSNTASIEANTSAIQSIQYVAESTVPKNVDDIAKNAEDIAANAQMIARNTTAISNNAAAIAQNTADIVDLKQELSDAKAELTAAYEAAIQDAIAALENGNSSDFAGQIADANSRIDNLASEVNDAIDAIETRVDALEQEIDGIRQEMDAVLQEIADLKESVQDLMKRIQSVTYIPKYSDGKATVVKNLGVDDGMAEFNFQISPKDAVTDIVANWESVLSMKAVETVTRAVTFIDMPVLSCEADVSTGVLTVMTSGENLSEEFFAGNQSVSAALYISDGNNCINSEFVELYPVNYSPVAPANEIWYTSTDNAVVTPNSDSAFGASIESNVYENGKGVIVFSTDLTEIGAEAFMDCVKLSSVIFPSTLQTLGVQAFYGCTSLESVKMNDSLTSIGACAFYGCGLKSVDIPDGVTEVPEAAFRNCTELQTVILNDNITSLAVNSFYSCGKLTNITLPSKLMYIGAYAFQDTSISNITIPSSVTTICNSAFSDSLLEVRCLPTAPPTAYNATIIAEWCAFGTNVTTIYVPSSSVSEYKSASYWDEYSDKIVGYIE